VGFIHIFHSPATPMAFPVVVGQEKGNDHIEENEHYQGYNSEKNLTHSQSSIYSVSSSTQSLHSSIISSVNLGDLKTSPFLLFSSRNCLNNSNS